MRHKARPRYERGRAYTFWPGELQRETARAQTPEAALEGQNRRACGAKRASWNARVRKVGGQVHESGPGRAGCMQGTP